MQKDELQSVIIEAIEDKKGKNIVTIDLSNIETSSAPAFIICQGSNTSQVNAIADNVIKIVKEKHGIKPIHSDGFRNSQWIILDYGSIMVHVFLPDIREFYNLEELWSDGILTEIPDIE